MVSSYAVNQPQQNFTILDLGATVK